MCHWHDQNHQECHSEEVISFCIKIVLRIAIAACRSDTRIRVHHSQDYFKYEEYSVFEL